MNGSKLKLKRNQGKNMKLTRNSSTINIREIFLGQTRTNAAAM